MIYIRKIIFEIEILLGLAGMIQKVLPKCTPFFYSKFYQITNKKWLCIAIESLYKYFSPR